MSKRKTVAQAVGLRVPSPEMVSLSAIGMAPYNPRVMTRDKMESLKASLRKHGLVLNLVLQRRSERYGADLVLVGGHQRVTAMREICAERGWALPDKLPATVLDLTDSEAMQLNVALNNIEGDFDSAKLGEMFSMIRSEMSLDDVVATGFSAEQIDDLIKLSMPQVDEPAIPDVGSFANAITLSVAFDTAERRDEAKTILRAWSKETGVQAGALLLRAVKAARASQPRSKRRKAAAEA